MKILCKMVLLNQRGRPNPPVSKPVGPSQKKNTDHISAAVCFLSMSQGVRRTDVREIPLPNFYTKPGNVRATHSIIIFHSPKIEQCDRPVLGNTMEDNGCDLKLDPGTTCTLKCVDGYAVQPGTGDLAVTCPDGGVTASGPSATCVGTFRSEGMVGGGWPAHVRLVVLQIRAFLVCHAIDHLPGCTAFLSPWVSHAPRDGNSPMKLTYGGTKRRNSGLSSVGFRVLVVAFCF